MWEKKCCPGWFRGLPRDPRGNESTCQSRIHKRHGFNHWVRQISWRRKWQHPLVFLPGESHGHRSPAGYSLWGHKSRILIFGVLLVIYYEHAQSCPTFCDPMDVSNLPQGSSIHGIFQARILEWVAIFFSGESSWPRDQTHISCVSCIDRWILYHWAT